MSILSDARATEKVALPDEKTSPVPVDLMRTFSTVCGADKQSFTLATQLVFGDLARAGMMDWGRADEALYLARIYCSIGDIDAERIHELSAIFAEQLRRPGAGDRENSRQLAVELAREMVFNADAVKNPEEYPDFTPCTEFLDFRIRRRLTLDEFRAVSRVASMLADLPAIPRRATMPLEDKITPFRVGHRRADELVNLLRAAIEEIHALEDEDLGFFLDGIRTLFDAEVPLTQVSGSEGANAVFLARLIFGDGFPAAEKIDGGMSEEAAFRVAQLMATAENQSVSRPVGESVGYLFQAAAVAGQRALVANGAPPK